MKKLAAIVAVALIFAASSTYAQTFLACPERDYSCQLKAAAKALEADPKNPENYYNMGLVFQRSGNHK